MNILKWVGCFLAVIVVWVLGLVLWTTYLKWITPIETIKDYVLNFFLFPISATILFIPPILVFFSTLISPNPKLACKIIGILAILSAVGRLTMPLDKWDWLPVFEEGLIAVYLLYGGFSKHT